MKSSFTMLVGAMMFNDVWAVYGIGVGRDVVEKETVCSVSNVMIKTTSREADKQTDMYLSKHFDDSLCADLAFRPTDPRESRRYSHCFPITHSLSFREQPSDRL
jgi:hypothetical protein